MDQADEELTADGIREGAAGEDRSSRPVYFLVHVPKCAGGTIERYLSANLDDSRYIELRNAPKLKRIFLRPHYRDPIGNLDGRKVDVVTNHPLATSFRRHFDDRPVRESVLLRSPLGHLASQYNQKYRGLRGRKYGKSPFEVWYRTKPANPISTFLLHRYFEFPMWKILQMSDQDKLDYLTEKLSRFWFVGDRHYCDVLIDRLAGEFELEAKSHNKGVATKKQKIADPESIDPDVRVAIEAESAVDHVLHQRFRDRLWDRSAIADVGLPPSGNLAGRLAREASRGFFMTRGHFERKGQQR